MRLDLPESLERVLSSTNLIENLFSRVRDTARRVKRWMGGMMILRWTAAGVLEAERHFRKVAGYRKWKAKYGGLEVSEARRLKSLEDENRRLKKLLAEAMLDNAALKDLLGKNG